MVVVSSGGGIVVAAVLVSIVGIVESLYVVYPLQIFMRTLLGPGKGADVDANEGSWRAQTLEYDQLQTHHTLQRLQQQQRGRRCGG